VGQRVVGIGVSDARRPLTIVARRLFAGLNEGLACPTVLWNSAEWVSIASGEGVLPRAEVCAVAEGLLGDVLGGFTCDLTMLDAFAHLVPVHEEVA